MRAPAISAYRLDTPGEAEKLFREIGVHPKGINIMRDKAVFMVFRLSSVPAPTCNIIKQEMLAAGGEAAVSKGVVSCEVEHSDVILLATVSTYHRLIDKLKDQPLGGIAIANELERELQSFSLREQRSLVIGEIQFKTFQQPLIMGILNVTPDSFFDGGHYLEPGRAAERARQIQEEGADIIDIGAQSTRPGAVPITEKEELDRLLPVLEAVAKDTGCPLSIDTWRARVAREAVDRGALIINDISALRFDESMVSVVAETAVSVVLTHMQETPETMQQAPSYRAVIPEITAFLAERASFAENNGIDKRKIILDPGIGFGKTLAHNLEIMNHLDAFQLIGYPVAVGPSRKTFIGNLLEAGPAERLNGTAAVVAAAVFRGVDIIRVHDVKEMSEVVRVASALSHPVE